MIRDPEVLQALRDSVQRYVRERLRPLEAQVAADDAIPDEVAVEMGQLGLFGLTIPEAYGGLGLTTEEEVWVAMDLGQTSPCFRSLIGTNNGIGSLGLIVDGREDQRARYLPRMASGELISSFALTEPEAGSDAASLRTTARATPQGFRLDGGKRYITNATRAGLFTVFARTFEENGSKPGISAFLVERGTPGFAIGKPEKKMGQAGSHVCDLHFDGCVVPHEALLGTRPGTGFHTAMKTLDRGRIHIAAVCVGVAQRMLDDALLYAAQRRQFGAAIGSFQLIQAMLADSQAELLAGRAMVLEAARQRDTGAPVVMEAACAKLFCSEMAGRVADRCVQVHGGAGYMTEYAIERFYRDVRLFRIYEGTSQIQQLVIARQMLKPLQ
jgi:acyl-CoA dehydrogenase